MASPAGVRRSWRGRRNKREAEAGSSFTRRELGHNLETGRHWDHKELPSTLHFGVSFPSSLWRTCYLCIFFLSSFFLSLDIYISRTWQTRAEPLLSRHGTLTRRFCFADIVLRFWIINTVFCICCVIIITVTIIQPRTNRRDDCIEDTLPLTKPSAYTRGLEISTCLYVTVYVRLL